MSLLSHYTSEAGLLGIARSKNLRATNFLSLNDTTEYFFAWAAIQRHALGQVYEFLPPDRRHPSFNAHSYAPGVNTKFRATVAGMDGYGALYVTSFARSQNDDHEKRGILTLWDRYTRCQGYCLQFQRGCGAFG